MFHCDEDSQEYERFRSIWEILNSDLPSDSDLDEAWKRLEAMKERDAEWHYASAAVKDKEAFDGLTAMADEAAKGNKRMPSREFDGCAETCLEGCCTSCC